MQKNQIDDLETRIEAFENAPATVSTENSGEDTEQVDEWTGNNNSSPDDNPDDDNGGDDANDEGDVDVAPSTEETTEDGVDEEATSTEPVD